MRRGEILQRRQRFIQLVGFFERDAALVFGVGR
jgi:hypothetical protein